MNIITAYFFLLVSRVLRVNLKSTLARLQPRSHECERKGLHQGQQKKKNLVCWLYFTSIVHFVQGCRNQPYFHLLNIFKKTLVFPGVMWPMPIASHALACEQQTHLRSSLLEGEKRRPFWCICCSQATHAYVFTDVLPSRGGKLHLFKICWGEAGCLTGKERQETLCFFFPKSVLNSTYSLSPLFVKYISSINQSIFYFTLQIVSFT